MGNIFETFVYDELAKGGLKINYWRTRTQQEVDFVITLSRSRIIGVEAKLNYAKAEISSTFAKEYKCKTYVVGLRGGKKGKYPWEIRKEIERTTS